MTTEPLFLIWSNQHAAWWRPDARGYTQFLEEAGRYRQADAVRIVKQATLDGRLKHRRTDPVTGVEYAAVDEWAVLAPESMEVAR